MPPKNTQNTDPSRSFFIELYEVEEEETEEPIQWPKENPFLALREATEASIEGLLTLSRPLLRRLLLDTSVDRRVHRLAHLARYSKKKRIRKKNLNRLYNLI